MENASKALIIAGAILLSILIIALGIYVFNMAKGATNTNSLDELEVSQFNQPFTNYRGKQLGSGVIDLLDKVIANAIANKDAEDRLPDIIYIDTRDLDTIVGIPQENNTKGTRKLDKTNKKEDIILKGFMGYSTLTGLKITVLESNYSDPNVKAFNLLRSKIAEKHYYQVGFNTNNDTGLIDYIAIAYN